MVDTTIRNVNGFIHYTHTTQIIACHTPQAHAKSLQPPHQGTQTQIALRTKWSLIN